MIGGHPHPNANRQEMVRVDTLDFQLVYDETGRVVYQVEEASRFGEKIAEGDLKYADFAPHESASTVSRFDGTYGLRRYTDAVDPQKEQNAIFEAEGMDCSDGLPIMEPEQVVEILPGNGSLITWIGEFVQVATGNTLVAVAGNRVYKRVAPGNWQLALTLRAAVSSGAAVASFAGKLFFGYAEFGIAQYTTDLVSLNDVRTSTPADMYVFAFTADHSNIYAVGGETQSTFNQVMSSPDGLAFATPIRCGRPDIRIRELAPGGGLVLVYVGKQNELGYIDNEGAVYHVLIPFDSYDGNNGTLLRWWLGRQDDQQRGPLALQFLRDRQLWQYAPSDQNTGEARNITVWADPSRRPRRVKGVPTAMAGTHRWLYYSVESNDATNWILKRDALSNSTTPYLALASNASCRAMCVTHPLGQSPALMYGVGANITYVTLPSNGEWPLDDPACRYKTGTGTLSMPEAELLLPDEDKILLSLRVIADDLLENVRYFTVQYAVDGGPLLALGTVFTSPITELIFDKDIDTIKGKRVFIKLTAHNTDPAHTMVLRGLFLRWSLNTKPYRQWTFQASVPSGRTQLPGSDLENPQRKIRSLWALRESGMPFVFADRWRATYITRLKSIREVATTQERERTPDTVLEIVLIQTTGVLPFTLTESWTMPAFDTSWYPITACWPVVDAGMLTAAGAVENSTAETLYPRWTITGPAATILLTNTVTGEALFVAHDLPHGATMVIVADPTRRIIVDAHGVAIQADTAGTFWGFPPGSSDFTVAVAGANLLTTVRLQRRG